MRRKAACGLGLHDTAFDPSLSADFRRRLARSVRPNRVFEAVREVVKATGVRGSRRRARRPGGPPRSARRPPSGLRRSGVPVRLGQRGVAGHDVLDRRQDRLAA
jgi:ferric-dicitrate binding protein FerR (iron transport regulator)